MHRLEITRRALRSMRRIPKDRSVHLPALIAKPLATALKVLLQAVRRLNAFCKKAQPPVCKIKAYDSGRLRIEGEEYLLQYGDVIEFRGNL